MKGLKPQDLAGKSVPELETLVAEERAALYKARRDLVFRQLTDTKQIAVRRHNIARLLTLITEKKSGKDPVEKAPKKETAAKKPAAKKPAAKKPAEPKPAAEKKAPAAKRGKAK